MWAQELWHPLSRKFAPLSFCSQNCVNWAIEMSMVLAIVPAVVYWSSSTNKSNFLPHKLMWLVCCHRFIFNIIWSRSKDELPILQVWISLRALLPSILCKAFMAAPVLYTNFIINLVLGFASILAKIICPLVAIWLQTCSEYCRWHVYRQTEWTFGNTGVLLIRAWMSHPCAASNSLLFQHAVTTDFGVSRFSIHA